MDGIVNAIETVNGYINDFVWGVPVLLLILGTGLFYTVRLGFIQFRHSILLVKETVVKAFRKKDDGTPKPGELTSFQAAMTSVGAIVGSGNIAGAATAIVMGGPGALVWMILAPLVGMATKFAVIAPFMGGLYILAGLAVIALHLPQVPAALRQVFQGAFHPQAVTGGTVGSVLVSMRYGIARGIYSNEAGLGTAAMVHCGAQVDHPVWGPIEVFLDTVLVCTVTALTIVLSGLWNTGLDGAVLTMRAFEAMLPGSVGGVVCTASVVLFGFTCLISFYTYAERAAVYIFGGKSKLVVKIFWVLMIFHWIPDHPWPGLGSGGYYQRPDDYPQPDGPDLSERRGRQAEKGIFRKASLPSTR